MADDVDVDAVRKQVASAFAQIASDLDSINRRARDATSSSGGIGKLDAAFSGMAKGLLGATGLAAGLYQVAKGIESVAVAGTQLQYLARDSGYATKSVTEMQGAMRMMGASAQEADRTVGNLGNKMQSLAVFKEGSEIWQGMAKFPGAGAAIANTLMGIAQEGMKTGDQMGATLKMLQLFNKQSPETKFAWAQVWGESVSHLENMERKLRITRDLAIPELNTAAHEKYLENLVGWQLKIESVWTHIASHAIEKINEVVAAQGEASLTTKDVIDWGNSEIDKTLRTLRNTMEEFRAIKRWWEGVKDNAYTVTGMRRENEYDPNHKPFDVHDIPGNKMYPRGDDPMGADYQRSQTAVGRFQGWWWGNQWYQGKDKPIEYPQGEDPMGKDYTRGRFHSNEYWNGKQRSGFMGTSDATDFSGRARRDDLVETEKESSKTLIEIRDTLQRMESGVPKSSSGGGGGGDSTFNIGTGIRGGNAQASVGGFRPNRRQGGMSGPDDGVGAGLSGSEFMAARRARFAEEAKDPKVRERLMAMMSSEGTPQQSLESLANRMDYSGRTLSAGLSPAFYGPMRNGIFEQHLAKIRSDPKLREKYDRMIDNVLVKGSNELGGRTDQGMPSDPNGMWGYGTPLWKKIGGNVFTDWGGGPGGHAGAARYRRMIEQGTAGELEARSKIDQAQAPDKWSGGINAKVEFLNVPGGVKTSADSDGDVFKQLQISRTKQMGVYNQSYGYE